MSKITRRHLWTNPIIQNCVTLFMDDPREKGKREIRPSFLLLLVDVGPADVIVVSTLIFREGSEPLTFPPSPRRPPLIKLANIVIETKSKSLAVSLKISAIEWSYF